LSATLVTGFGPLSSDGEANPIRYTVVLEPDGAYVASVPALPGCVSHGDTPDEAMRNTREAAALYIEDCIASGDPFTDPTTHISPR
jgi:predicted RNase H-like HicB family nuclease